MHARLSAKYAHAPPPPPNPSYSAVNLTSHALGTGRVFWAFARDGGLPNMQSSWAKVNPHFETPFNAQLCVGIITALLGCIYLGSSTAFNAMMSSAV